MLAVVCDAVFTIVIVGVTAWGIIFLLFGLLMSVKEWRTEWKTSWPWTLQNAEAIKRRAGHRVAMLVCALFAAATSTTLLWYMGGSYRRPWMDLVIIAGAQITAFMICDLWYSEFYWPRRGIVFRETEWREHERKLAEENKLRNP